MYPDLSYLFHDLLGTAPDGFLSIFKTFGFFLAISFLLSAVVFYAELKRKSQEGFYQPVMVEVTEGQPATPAEIASNALIGLLLGGKGLYAYLNFASFRHDPASVILSAKMHWPAAIFGAAALGFLTWYEAHRNRKNPPVTKQVKMWPYHRISEMTVAAAFGGIVGAKTFDLIDNWDSFLADPIGSLTSGGGLAIYGGLFLGFVAVVTYIYRQKIPFLPTADAVAPALVAGYGMGRVGCQLSGDGDWGIVNTASKPGWMSFLPDWMWAYQYPHHVLNAENTDPVFSTKIPDCTWDYCYQLSQPVYPTPFYETLMMIAVFGILWALRKRLNVPGMLFFIYVFMIAFERICIEQIRVNVKHEVLGMQLTQAEVISALLMAVALGGGLWVWRKHKAAGSEG